MLVFALILTDYNKINAGLGMGYANLWVIFNSYK